MSSPDSIPQSGSDGLDDYPDIDRYSCQLLGPTALVVQALMGLLAILSLVYKRQREKPKRIWKIWVFDVSKQIVGQLFVHGVNLLISDLVSHHSLSNACVSYFLNILLDTTLGVALLYLILRFFAYVLTGKLNLKGFESGQYGTPPSIFFWARQAAVYVLSLTSMKLLVLLLLALFPGIYDVGEWLLSWTWTGEGDALQVIFVMGIFPIMMNIMQFWLIDSIVKASAAVALPPDSRRSSFDGEDREPLFVASDDEGDDLAGQPRYDVENPRPPSRARAQLQIQKSDPPTPEGDESSSSLNPGTEMRGSVAMHAYPPSTSTINSSSPPSPSRPRKTFKRRSPPPPLNLEPPAPQDMTLMQEPTKPTRPNDDRGVAPDEPNKKWADDWDDSDDWANRVGEEEWTGRRMEQTKEALTVMVQASVAG